MSEAQLINFTNSWWRVSRFYVREHKKLFNENFIVPIDYSSKDGG